MVASSKDKQGMQFTDKNHIKVPDFMVDICVE